MKIATADVHVIISDDFEGGVQAGVIAASAALVEAQVNGLISAEAVDVIGARFSELLETADAAIKCGRSMIGIQPAGNA